MYIALGAIKRLHPLVESGLRGSFYTLDSLHPRFDGARSIVFVTYHVFKTY